VNAPPQPFRILVVANETVGGRALIDEVKKKAEEAHADHRPFAVTVICPQNRPREGYVIYDDNSLKAAENRLMTTLAQLRAVGILATGAVMDPDPYSATTDAVAAYGADCIIISTHPETRSGWMRRDLIERVRQETGIPVDHVVVDLEADKDEVTVTLVVANETVAGEPLIQLLKEKAESSPHSFVVICPQGGKAGDPAARLAATLERLTAEGLEAAGQIMDADPYTAIKNAMQYYAVDEIVVSTFPATRSGWMRGDLIERVRSSTAKPVEHVVVEPAEAREGDPAQVSA